MQREGNSKKKDKVQGPGPRRNGNGGKNPRTREMPEKGSQVGEAKKKKKGGGGRRKRGNRRGRERRRVEKREKKHKNPKKVNARL